jgi:hypothetical protein
MIQPPHEALTTVIIRRMQPSDGQALGRLAARDSTGVPSGALLVAEVNGELRAAVPLDAGRPVADPFHRTAEIVRLLELRRAQIARVERQGRRPVWRRATGRLSFNRQTRR